MHPLSNISRATLAQIYNDPDPITKVLVVDDEPGVLSAIKRQTFDLPIDLFTCATIEQAKATLAQHAIDIAFVDHQLGEAQTGLEFLSELSQDNPHTFRVIFTGESDFSFAVSAINHGRIDAFLPKPWSSEQLNTLIRQGAAHSQLRFMNAALNQQLAERNAELESLNKNLETIVATRTEELAETNNRLHMYRDDIVHLETQAAISQLVRGLAHELNNPLGIILGHAQRLKRLHKENPDVQDCMLVVEEEIERCRKLIERLRSYSVADDSVSQHCSIEDICEIAIDRLEQRGFDLPDISLIGSIPAFSASPRAFARAIDQIFENAVYARAQHITVSHHYKHNRLSLHIDNDGLTPSDEEVRNAVKPFYSKRQTATGLGLSIASAILAEHGCMLNFTVNPEGSGARCTILMPIPEPNHFESAHTLGAIKTPTMLILDDEPLITELILEALNGSTCTAAVAASIKEAQQIIDQETISCCIVDAHLPDGNGCTFLQELVHKHPQLKHHVALISGDPNQPSIVELQAALGCPVLAKPFPMAALNALIAEIR